jgi:hypothetical protein
MSSVRGVQLLLGRKHHDTQGLIASNSMFALVVTVQCSDYGEKTPSVFVGLRCWLR